MPHTINTKGLEVIAQRELESVPIEYAALLATDPEKYRVHIGVDFGYSHEKVRICVAHGLKNCKCEEK